MKATKRLAAAAAASITFGVLAVASATEAVACTPHVNSQGPTVTIAPNYGDPTKSDWSYDPNDMYVQVITCLG